MLKKISLLIGTAALAFAAASPALADGDRGLELPFRFRFENDIETLTVDPAFDEDGTWLGEPEFCTAMFELYPPDGFVVAVAGIHTEIAGRGYYIGRFTGEMQFCQYVQDPVFENGELVDGVYKGLGIGEMNGRFGRQLVLTFDATVDPEQPGVADAVVINTDGTGVFRYAEVVEGNGTAYDPGVDPDFPTGGGEFDGTISFTWRR